MRKHRHRRHRKEVFIPLKGDSEFLTLLATALASLAALQTAQKQQFANAVQLLAKDVSNVASPSRSKNDLYVWREIFSLWVEAQIFESERERDRGERTVEEAEKRLDWFVAQVAQRTLAKKMRNKESKEALERFIKLNVQLLDLKRFQLANEEAARKIVCHRLSFSFTFLPKLIPVTPVEETRQTNCSHRISRIPRVYRRRFFFNHHWSGRQRRDTSSPHATRDGEFAPHSPLHSHHYSPSHHSSTRRLHLWNLRRRRV